MTSAARLAGKKVLIVEDQYLIADDLTRMFARLGADIIGPHASSADAMTALKDEPVDFAVLDIALAGNAVYSLARELRLQGVSFLFLTGVPGESIDGEFSGVPVLEKPHNETRLVQLIETLGWPDR